MSATFTGSSYLSIASVPASQVLKSSPVSFAIWVRPTSVGGTVIDTGTLGYFLGIVSSNVDPGPPVNFKDTIAIFNDSGSGTWFLDLEQNEFAEELGDQGDANVTNAWVHYAATYDGSNTTSGGMVLYKNGQPIANNITSAVAVTSTIAWNRVVVGGFAGDAQDAFVFNRVLSAGEIADLYRGRTQRVSTANIVGHWPLFGDNLGLDISGQGRNLSATGTVVKGSNNAPTSNWFPGSIIALRTVAVSSGQDLGVTTGTTQTTGSVTLGELAAVTPAGTTNTTGAVTLGALKALAPAGTTNTTGSATFGQLAAVQPAGTTNVTGSVTFAELAALTPAGMTATTGSVTFGSGAASVRAPSGIERRWAEAGGLRRSIRR